MTTEEREQLLRCPDETLLKQCKVDAYRASGPGGQKRNKTSSAVRLRHVPTGLIVISEDSRSQHENKAKALRRLRLAIATEIRTPEVDTSTCPSLMDQYINPDGILRITRKNDDFLQIASIVLDFLSAHRGAVRDAASSLGTNSSQLTRFLAIEPKVLAAANRIRFENNMKPISS